MERIRQSLFSTADKDRTHLIAEYQVTQLRLSPLMQHRVFDPQFAAEVIVGATYLTTLLLQVAIAIDAFVSSRFSASQRIIVCLVATASVLAAAAISILYVRLRVAAASGDDSERLTVEPLRPTAL